MKPLFATILGVLVMGLGLYFGAIWGMRHGAFNAALEENKLASLLLNNRDVELSPEFTEYLKGRIYYNIASKYPNDQGYLLRKDWDFGEVRSTLLRDRPYAKDPTFNCDSFDEATKNLTRAEQGAAPNP